MSASLDQILEVLPKKAFAYSNIFSLFSSSEIKDPVKKAQKICKSQLEFQRLVLAKSLLESAYEIGYTSFVKNILPIANNLANDKSSAIRESICNQIGGIAGFLMQQSPEEGVEQSISSLLPILERLIDDQNWMVRKSACQSLFSLSAHLRQMGNQPIISLALKMANGPNSQSTKYLASFLLDGLAETVGTEVCVSFFVPQIRCLAEDSDPIVRKSVPGNLQNICNVIGFNNVVSKIHPLYKEFCVDIDSRVRNSAVIHLPSLIRCSPMDERKKFISIMEVFLDDPIKSIRYLAIKIMGEFFVSLSNKDDVDIKLLKQFAEFSSSTLKTKIFSSITDLYSIPHYEEPNELDSISSLYFSFARFLAPLWEILEDEAWHHLRDTLLFLHKYEDWNIRQELAKYFHRIVASSINSIKSHEDNENSVSKSYLRNQFYNIFQVLLLDEVVDVKINILHNLKDYLKAFQQFDIEDILKNLKIIKTNSGHNWRVRFEISEQLENFWKQSASPLSTSLLLSLTLSLCKDTIYEVRRKAIQSIPSFLSRCCPRLISLSQDEENGTGLQTYIQESCKVIEKPIEDNDKANERKSAIFHDELEIIPQKDYEYKGKDATQNMVYSETFLTDNFLTEIDDMVNSIKDTTPIMLSEFYEETQKMSNYPHNTEPKVSSQNHSIFQASNKDSPLKGYDEMNFYQNKDASSVALHTTENGLDDFTANEFEKFQELAMNSYSNTTELSRARELANPDNTIDTLSITLDNLKQNSNNKDKNVGENDTNCINPVEISQHNEIFDPSTPETYNISNYNLAYEITSTKITEDSPHPPTSKDVDSAITNSSIADFMIATEFFTKTKEQVDKPIKNFNDSKPQPHSSSSGGFYGMFDGSSVKASNQNTTVKYPNNKMTKKSENSKTLTYPHSRYGERFRALDAHARRTEMSYILMLLNDFFRSEKYTERQSFIYICDEIIRTLPKSFFDYFFSLSLASLSYDKVNSVRISWAKTLFNHFRPKGRLVNNAILVECALNMQLGDKRSEDSNYFNSVKLNEPALINFEEGLDFNEIKKSIESDYQAVIS